METPAENMEVITLTDTVEIKYIDVGIHLLEALLLGNTVKESKRRDRHRRNPITADHDRALKTKVPPKHGKQKLGDTTTQRKLRRTHTSIKYLSRLVLKIDTEVNYNPSGGPERRRLKLPTTS